MLRDKLAIFNHFKESVTGNNLSSTFTRVAVAVPAVMLMITTSAFADTTDPDSAIVTSMTSSLQGIGTDALAGLTSVAPYAISVMGGYLVWRYGVKFFKGLAK